MRTILSLVAVAGLLTCTACDPKQPLEGSPSSSTSLEEAANATDIAETTASPIDTAGYSTDSLVTDSI